MTLKGGQSEVSALMKLTRLDTHKQLSGYALGEPFN